MQPPVVSGSLFRLCWRPQALSFLTDWKMYSQRQQIHIDFEVCIIYPTSNAFVSKLVRQET
jgi:hypothetical protein